MKGGAVSRAVEQRVRRPFAPVGELDPIAVQRDHGRARHDPLLPQQRQQLVGHRDRLLAQAMIGRREPGPGA